MDSFCQRPVWLRLAAAGAVAAALAQAALVPVGSLAADADADGDASCLLQRAPAERRQGSLEQLRLRPPPVEGSIRDEEGLLQYDSNISSCKAVGGRLWISRKGVDYLLDKFLPEAEKIISTTEMAAKEGKMYGFTYSVSDIKLSDLFIARPVVDFVKGAGLDIHLPNVSLAVNCKYKVQGSDWWNPLYSSGSVHAIVAPHSEASGLLKVGVTDAGKPHLNFTLGDLRVGLQKLDFTGTVISGLTNVLTDTFKDYIEGMLSASISAAVEEFVNTELNGYMNVLDLKFPLPLPAGYNFSAADLRLCGVHTSPTALVIDVSGAIVDPKKPSLVYPEEPDELPHGPPMNEEEFKSHMIVMMLTKWTINSGLWLYNVSNKLNVEIMTQDLPDNSPIVLNANTLGPLISSNPDVPRWWWNPDQEGKSKAFSVVVETHDLPVVHFEDGTISVKADTSLGFKLQGIPTAGIYATSVRAPLSMKMGLSIIGANKSNVSDVQKIHADIAYVSALPISIEGGSKTTNLWTMSAFVQLLTKTSLVPMLNHAFADFPFPSAAGVTMLNTSINISQSLIFATDLDINASKVMDIAYYGTSVPSDWDDWGETPAKP